MDRAAAVSRRLQTIGAFAAATIGQYVLWLLFGWSIVALVALALGTLLLFAAARFLDERHLRLLTSWFTRFQRPVLVMLIALVVAGAGHVLLPEPEVWSDPCGTGGRAASAGDGSFDLMVIGGSMSVALAGAGDFLDQVEHEGAARIWEAGGQAHSSSDARALGRSCGADAVLWVLEIDGQAHWTFEVLGDDAATWRMQVSTAADTSAALRFAADVLLPVVELARDGSLPSRAATSADAAPGDPSPSALPRTRTEVVGGVPMVAAADAESLLASSPAPAPAWPGLAAVRGDWDGDGITSPGWYEPADGQVTLLASFATDAVFAEYRAGTGLTPLVGDFDGDGVDTIAFYDARRALVLAATDHGAPDLAYHVGKPGAAPFVGDFDGDGIDTIGLHYRGDRLILLFDPPGVGAAGG